MIMNSLTDLRNAIAQVVSGSMGALPTFPAWPANISAPCAIIELGAGTQHKRLHWIADWHVTLVGPVGDNTAAADWVQGMTIVCARDLSEHFTTKVAWSRPDTTLKVGTTHTYYVAQLTFALNIEPDPIPVE
jgi:hypothetical protein